MAIGLNQQLKLILLLAAFLPIKQLVAQDDYALEPWLIEPSAFFASVPESDKYFEGRN